MLSEEKVIERLRYWQDKRREMLRSRDPHRDIYAAVIEKIIEELSVILEEPGTKARGGIRFPRNSFG